MFKSIGDLLNDILKSVLGLVVIPVINEVKTDTGAILSEIKLQTAVLNKISADGDAIRAYLGVPLNDTDQQALDSILAATKAIEAQAAAINTQPPKE